MCLAIPGKILSVARGVGLGRTGEVSFGSSTLKVVNLAYVPEASVGDYVIVHGGFAISRLDEPEANSVLEYLRQMDNMKVMGTP